MQGSSDDNVSVGENKEVYRVAVKLPQFWEKYPQLWFANIEAQFIVAGITSDETKFYSVVSALNSDILNYVSDIVLNPPTHDRYVALKNRLVSEFSDSEQKRLKTLLSELALGDEKPSHLLRQMRQLAGQNFDEGVLKTLWLQRLPKETQAILSISDDALDKLAVMADKIVETTVSSQSHVQAISSQTDPQILELQKQVLALTERIDRLARPRNRRFQSKTRSRTNSPHYSRDTHKNKNKSELCWYHATFGVKARKCRFPCEFDKQAEN